MWSAICFSLCLVAGKIILEETLTVFVYLKTRNELNPVVVTVETLIGSEYM